MKSSKIRSNFIDFFNKKYHYFINSAPLVVKNDPTLMFTNAGMNQFKDYFLGNKISPHKRVANSQKCLRVSGKHNDLEEVGIDTYHHTMFEMLGNWSFGDYFKKEAIQWAWELLTQIYHLPQERMYASVFGGDPDDNLPMDQEAFDLWREIIPEDRIILGSKKDNFWEMGDTGPCGPSSEIHIDLRPQAEVDQTPGKDLVNNDHPLVIEIWNLVFIQFNRLSSGKLEPLPDKHVDTGMGLERLVMAIQQKTSNYDTDIFQPLIEAMSKKSGISYGNSRETDIAIRVIADHIRAITFAIADGQLPSNVKAGYVIRRILRRAVRYGYTFLGLKEPFLYELVDVLAEQFADVYPEVQQQQEFIAKVIQEEEASFLRTLEKGLKRFDEEVKLKRRGTDALADAVGEEVDPIIAGYFAFELYDTYGFPIDLTQLLASELGLEVDIEGFNANMELQRQKSRVASSQDKGDWVVLKEEETSGEFLGYDQLEAEAQIVKYRQVSEKNKSFYQLVLDKTPFYAEGGGQVGDTGYLESDGEKISIFDTKKENDLIIHFAKELPKKVESTFHCVVNAQKRLLTQNNHTATHLMHAALREVLGNHVAQKGSLVNDKLLRFDFSHFAKMTDEEISEVEHRVNRKIRENIPLNEMRNVPIDKAKAMGATALFGEKYGDFVRVIVFDPAYSIELCGGTHVPATGSIGFFKIVSESSVAAGVRRIEAITAETAEAYVDEQLSLLTELKEVLKSPKDLKKAVESLLQEKGQLSKEIESLQNKDTAALKDQLLNQISQINGANVIIQKVKLPNADSLKKISFEIRNEQENICMVLAADINGKPQISVIISDSLVEKYQLNAGAMVKELAREIKGGGGGQPFYATAGGNDLGGLDQVIEKAKDLLETQLLVSK